MAEKTPEGSMSDFDDVPVPRRRRRANAFHVDDELEDPIDVQPPK